MFVFIKSNVPEIPQNYWHTAPKPSNTSSGCEERGDEVPIIKKRTTEKIVTQQTKMTRWKEKFNQNFIRYT